MLFILLVRCPVHTPVGTPMFGLPLSQSDRRILSVSQSVMAYISRHTVRNSENETFSASVGHACQLNMDRQHVIKGSDVESTTINRLMQNFLKTQ